MIQLKNITIKSKEKTLIDQFSIKFNKGEIWAILGKNGVGKTTLLHTIAGFNTNYNGCVLIDNVELKTINVLNRAQMLALLPQKIEANLDCTVRQSISYARYPWHEGNNKTKIESEIIEDAMSIMALEDLKDKSIHHISGGELQRVEISTVLAQDSDILLFDEPFNHLDIVFRFQLMEYLQNISPTKTIIISTHDIQYIQDYCSHVLMIIDSSHVLSGTLSEVLTHQNLTQMLGKQVADKILNIIL